MRPDGTSSGEMTVLPSGLPGSPEPHPCPCPVLGRSLPPCSAGLGVLGGGQARPVSVVSVWPDHSLLVLRAAFNPWLLGFTGCPFAVGQDVGRVSLLME